MNDHLRFLGTFIRNPRKVGAIAPSSRGLARMMIEESGLDGARTVVELGPGTGSFTREIEASMDPEALYLALELDPKFAERLGARCERARVIQDSAEQMPKYLEEHGREHADVVFSGLPYASFSADLQERIMKSVVRGLRPGGKYCTFSYVHCRWMPSLRRYRRWLERHFDHVTTSRVVWANLPPAYVFRCQKAATATADADA